MNNLNERIQHFYDQSSRLWLKIWGEHMHHGYYGPDGKSKKEHQQAQVDLIEALLDFGQVKQAPQILDVGCGVGGGARYLAKKYKAAVLGITLSPVQVQQGNRYNEVEGLANQITLKVQDVYELNPATLPQFDLIYSMESAEHMPEKEQLLELFLRLLRPGGQLLMATWCHRPEETAALSNSEQRLLERLYRLYHLPPMISLPTYARLADKLGYEEIQTADWSDAVAPFWRAVIRSALTFRGFLGLLGAGPSTLKGAWAMRYMQAGYRSGLIRFGVLTARKKAD